MKNKLRQKSIPDGWQKIKLKSISEKIGSGVTPRGGSAVYLEEGIKFLRSQNVQNGYLDLKDISCISEVIDCQMKSSRVYTNDVLYNITGASIGRSALYALKENANVNQHVCIIRIKKDSPKFVNYFLLSVSGAKVLFGFQAGGNREGLNFNQLGSFKLLLPPLPEQKRIVAVLETWDEYLDKLARKIEIKKNIKKGLMQQLLTGKKRVKGFDGEWQRVRLGDVCDIRRGGSPRPIQKFLTKDEDGYNWLRIGDIGLNDRYIYATEEKIIKEGLSKTTLVNRGDFILSNSMSFGRPYIMQTTACIHDGWLALMNIKPEYVKSFLFYLLLSHEMQSVFMSISAGSGVQNLKKESVSCISLRLPEFEEQTAIANILTKADEEIEALEKKKTIIEAQKKYLLNNLITGKIRTPEDLFERVALTANLLSPPY